MPTPASEPAPALPAIPSQLICLAGPTASGKSAVALCLAEKIGGEIVSVDSMQVYRGMDIGTAKPSLEERARVTHHLVDILDLKDGFDAAQFVKLAGKAVHDIVARGRVPILCGGSGLYFKAFFDGLGQAPPSDSSMRAELEASPLPELLRELALKDPPTYEKIDRRNPRRVIRALEVIRLTGKLFSQQRALWRSESVGNCFGLMRQSGDLRRRIDARVEAMFRQGLVPETKALMPRGLAENKIAMQALGYRQVIEHLQGIRSLPDTIGLVKIRTRQFAKRQMTWFGRQLQLTWIKAESGDTAGEIASIVAAGLRPVVFGMSRAKS